MKKKIHFHIIYNGSVFKNFSLVEKHDFAIKFVRNFRELCLCPAGYVPADCCIIGFRKILN